ncbi:MAG: hypothetical protein F4X98_03275 [Gammaproteobacteria bacterium]|nr:hypothetical protein [Gammaproteobacteria bacterium]
MSETAQPQRPLTATRPITARRRSRGLGALLDRLTSKRSKPSTEDGESASPTLDTEGGAPGTSGESEPARIRRLAKLWNTHPILEEADLMYQDLKPITQTAVRDWVKRTCGDRAAVRIRQGDEGVEACWIITDDPNSAEVEAATSLLALKGWPVEVHPAVPRLVAKASNPDQTLTETEVQAKLRELLKMALALDASDIHFEMREPDTAAVRFRVDGEMREITGEGRPLVTVPIIRQLGNYMFTRLAKRGSRQFTTTEPLNASAQTKVDDQTVALRFATAPEIRGVDIYIRVWKPDQKPLQLHELGYRPSQLRELSEAIRKPYGVIVFSGPTGSGKSSSLTALLDGFTPSEKARRKIISLEEPVERELRHVTHVSVSGLVEHAGWKALLGGLNRWDSNINVLGEIKDGDTADAIQDLATAGKLTLTTLHAANVLSIPTRMEDLGVEHEMLYDPNFLVLMVNQRLVPKLCTRCKRPLRQIRQDPKHGMHSGTEAGADEGRVGEDESSAIKRLSGLFPRDPEVSLRGVDASCDGCQGTGITGRVLVAEVVVVDDQAREFIRHRRWDAWREALRKEEWPSIRDHAMEYVRAGLVDPRDVEETVCPLDEDEYAHSYAEDAEPVTEPDEENEA